MEYSGETVENVVNQLLVRTIVLCQKAMNFVPQSGEHGIKITQTFLREGTLMMYCEVK